MTLKMKKQCYAMRFKRLNGNAKILMRRKNNKRTGLRKENMETDVAFKFYITYVVGNKKFEESSKSKMCE